MLPCKKILITFLCLAGWWGAGFGQSSDQDRTVIYRKSAPPVRGILLSYQQGVGARMETDAGQLVEIPEADIKQVRQGEAYPSPAPRKNPPREVLSRPEGWFNATSLAFLPGQTGRNSALMGVGFGNVTGYRFRRWSLGIGVGADVYDRWEETVFPVYGECKAYLAPGDKGAWYLNASGGYGFAWARRKFDVSAAEGGYHIRPGIGFQGHGKDGLAFFAETGLRMQSAAFTRAWFNGDVETRDILFRRLSFTVGLSLVRTRGGR